MGHRVQLVGALGQHRLGDDQFTHQVDQLIHFLHRHANARGLAGTRRWFFTAGRSGRLFWHGFQGRGSGNYRRGILCRSRRFNGRRLGFKRNLIRFNHEAEHRHDVILANPAVERRGQAVFALHHVAERRQVPQLLFQQVDLVLLQT